MAAGAANRQRADLLFRIASIRWAGILLSFVLVPLTNPPPVLPVVLLGVTLLMAAYNLPMMFSRRVSNQWLARFAVGSLAGDFIFCTTWVALTGNDPSATVYVIYMVIAVEAAVLFYWRGTAAFLVAFFASFAAIYVEKWAVFHEPRSIGSMIFRFGIVTVMATMSGSLSSATEKQRANAEASALEAFRESARLETVHRLARGLGSSLRRDDVLKTAAAALRLLFPKRWTGVLLDDGAGMARLAAGSGHPDQLAIKLPDETLLPAVDETLIFEDLWTSPILQAMGIAPPETLRDYAAAAVVPLHIGARRLGAIVVLDGPGGKFGADDVRALEAIAPQIATALDNARLYEETESLSLTDPLTRLGNRRAFEQRLEEEIQRSQRHERALSLVLLDIDHFKVYNDMHGHQAGDDILRRLGTALSERLLRHTDVGFRYGGEEFAVIMPETTAAQAEAVMQRVHEVLALEPLPLGDHQPGGYLTLSAGVTTCAGGPSGVQDLVEHADLALFGAKQSGRNRTVVYDSELAASLTNWTRVLPSILREGALHAVYQPIVRLDNRVVVAYEALARPDGRDAGINVEGMFGAAQRLGILHDLDWLCFRAAVDGAGSRPLGEELFVNITLAAMLDATRDPEFAELVLHRMGRSPAGFVFEISEREAVTDKPRLQRILKAYRERGFRFALDDVGEGHSTFELLAAAEPEYVKIARSLVVDAASQGSVGTIRALVEFGRSTGARVVAEGIEDEESALRMHSLGVELGQGYGLGIPGALPSEPMQGGRFAEAGGSGRKG
jgi:diguanylate cyclase (GGDEF)-like protein